MTNAMQLLPRWQSDFGYPTGSTLGLFGASNSAHIFQLDRRLLRTKPADRNWRCYNYRVCNYGDICTLSQRVN